ncbi:MAG: hypothetical protein JWQ96_557 [Segetibacter sp.]|nr:hypothetical protein [Segetibacter sp.]
MFCLVGITLACNDKTSNASNVNSKTTYVAKDPDVERGLQLVANSDCLSCHKISEPMTGPSYKAIANKYQDNSENISSLVKKIIIGGSGVWGQVMMTPHPQVSKQDAETMVKYIFSLKDTK